MLDQFFSSENFRKILDYENRKGLNLERKYFPNVFRITKEISAINIKLRGTKKESTEEITRLKNQRAALRVSKEELLMSELQSVANKVVDKNFKFNLRKKEIEDEKTLYLIPDIAENFFTMKQIQTNVSKLYKVKQANRSSIVNQIKCLLDDDFPKYIIRTDIKDFYESIPHDRLLKKIHEDSLLSFFSKRIISKLLEDYRVKSGTRVGVPRGIGLSAYLSELYMRNIDNSIRALPEVTYYARYVDDIVIIFSPDYHFSKLNYLDKIKIIIENENGLNINVEKTKPYDLAIPRSYQLDYLGYKIFFGNGPVKILLTNKKDTKYRDRIDASINAYNSLKKVDEKKARQIFVKRIRFLTGNTRLISFTKNVLVGVYYSNNLLTSYENLVGLDRYLNHKIESNITSENLKNRLKKYSFRDGFEKKMYSVFTPNDLTEIVKVWKTI